MAALDNASASDIDKTSFWWAGLCAICHVGGGPTEYDRDGDLFFDVSTGEMGYQARGETDAQQEFDGDYSLVSNQNGSETHPAPWNKTGVGEPDCLYCHRAQRHVDVAAGKNFNWIFRAGTIRGSAGLKNTAGQDVPAFASAPAAGMEWGTTTLDGVSSPPKATTFDLDYAKGVADGSLIAGTDGLLKVAQTAIQKSPNDWSCWGCHAIADDKKRGRTWFNPDEDVHYAAYNNLDENSTSTERETAAMSSTACSWCHPVTGTPQKPDEHNFAKGNANLGSARNDTDYYGFKSCRDCHLDGPDKDPNAPLPVSPIHTSGHLASISCQFCHIPQKHDNASLAIDNATTGMTIDLPTDRFLSADPLDPSNADKSAWFPSATVRKDSDGVDRIFPAKLLLSVWIGDWDDKTGNGPTSDDLISALPLWQVRMAIAAGGLSSVDDNGDGKPEVNTDAEIKAYLTWFQNNNDTHGNPLADGKSCLIKGGKAYYLDAGNNVASFDLHTSGIKAEAEHPFSVDHNVLPLARDLTLGVIGCGECHVTMNGGNPTRVFDRLILSDMSDMSAESTVGAGDGAHAEYETLRAIFVKMGWSDFIPGF